MKRILSLTALAFTVAAAAPAFAENKAACGNAPRDQWLSEEAAKTKATGLGYEVRRVKVEDGCYEIYAIDKNGAKVELYLNPASGDMVDAGTGEND